MTMLGERLGLLFAVVIAVTTLLVFASFSPLRQPSRAYADVVSVQPWVR